MGLSRAEKFADPVEVLQTDFWWMSQFASEAHTLIWAPPWSDATEFGSLDVFELNRINCIAAEITSSLPIVPPDPRLWPLEDGLNVI